MHICKQADHSDYLIVARLGIVDRISAPTVEKGSDFIACTFVLHMDMGIDTKAMLFNFFNKSGNSSTSTPSNKKYVVNDHTCHRFHSLDSSSDLGEAVGSKVMTLSILNNF